MKYLKLAITIPWFIWLAWSLNQVIAVFEIWRGIDKQHRINALQTITKPIHTHASTPTMHTHVQLKGKDTGQILLLDNQWLKHQLGYEVYTLYQYQKQLILIDRGWIKDSNNPIAKLKNDITGIVYPVEANITLSERGWAQPLSQGRTKIQSLKQGLMNKYLHINIAPWMLKLDASAHGAFPRQWQTNYLTPHRHYGYALQFTLFGWIILIIYVLHRKKHG